MKTPTVAWVGGSGVPEKIRDSHHSLKHPFPALSQTKTHTQSLSHHPRATHYGSPHLWTPPSLLPGWISLENSAWAPGEGYIYSKDQGSDSSRLAVLGGGLYRLLPSPWLKALCHHSPLGPGPQTPRLGCGVGEGRRGRLLPARHKETSFSLGSMATLGMGAVCTQYFLPHLQV